MSDDQTPGSADEVVAGLARRARRAAAVLATTHRASKDAALQAMADALVARSSEVLVADVESARDGRTPEHLVDRLRLDEGRIAALAQDLRDVAGASRSGGGGRARLDAAERPAPAPGPCADGG